MYPRVSTAFYAFPNTVAASMSTERVAVFVYRAA